MDTSMEGSSEDLHNAGKCAGGMLCVRKEREEREGGLGRKRSKYIMCVKNLLYIYKLPFFFCGA